MRKIASSILIIALVLAVSGCGKDKSTIAQNEDGTAVNVSVAMAEKKTIEDTVTYTGEIKASEYTGVSAKASGIAKTVYVQTGDYVNEGDILLQIDDTDYRAQYNQAKAAYEAALAQYKSITNGGAQQTKLQLESVLNSAKIEYNNAQTNYDNQKVLYENGAISKSVYDGAVTRFENAKINLKTAQDNYDITVGVVLSENEASAQANVNSAQAALTSANNMLSNTILRAPISGYIGSRNANKGQMVAQGVELFSIKATEVVEAQINVTESIISSVQIGAKAVINVRAAQMSNIEGTVTALSPVKNAQTGLYQIKIAINNFDGKLKDGMFADVKLTLSQKAEAVVIPSEAILEDEKGTKYVYTAQGETALRCDVAVGIITDEYTELMSGVKPGEKVIVSGQDYLSDKNNKIRVVKKGGQK